MIKSGRNIDIYPEIQEDYATNKKKLHSWNLLNVN